MLDALSECSVALVNLVLDDFVFCSIFLDLMLFCLCSRWVVPRAGTKHFGGKQQPINRTESREATETHVILNHYAIQVLPPIHSFVCTSARLDYLLTFTVLLGFGADRYCMLHWTVERGREAG